MADRLDDELYALNERLGEQTFPKSAKAYLDDWSATQAGWLRKYYPPDSDEPHYDATSAVEKVVAWVRSLEARSFIGTESRLNTVFELLRQMKFGAESDPEARLEELKRRRLELDEEIARVEHGEVSVLDRAGLRDRYQQVTATAHELLADFREVEANAGKFSRDRQGRLPLGWHFSFAAGAAQPLVVAPPECVRVRQTVQGDLRVHDAHVFQARPARTRLCDQSVRVDGEEVSVECPVKRRVHRQPVTGVGGTAVRIASKVRRLHHLRYRDPREDGTWPVPLEHFELESRLVGSCHRGPAPPAAPVDPPAEAAVRR